MPAIGNIVLTDAEATPVSHTFAPVTTNGETAKLANRSAVAASGFETLQVSLSPPSGNRTTYRLATNLYDPVEATVSGVTSVVRYNSAVIRIDFAPDSTAQERKNSLKILSNALAHATIVTCAENLEQIY